MELLSTLGTIVFTLVSWIVVAAFVGMILWLAGAAIYMTILDIRDIPKRRATKASNARVDAIKAAKRERDRAECARLYGTK